MCKDETYNGWTNRETWLINFWFNPETVEDVESAQAYFEEAYDNLPNFMQDFVYESSINWDELKKAMDDFENEEE